MRLVAAVTTISVSALLVVVTASTAWACSCAPMSLDEQVGRADTVFVGRAVAQAPEEPREITSSLDPVTWTFTVDRVHKGTAAGPQQVETVSNEASCGYGFTAGRTYLVVGSGVGSVSTGLCDGTRPASAVTVADGAVLGEGTVPAVAPVPAADPIPEPEAPAPPPWWLVGVPVVALLGGAWWYRRRA